MPKPYNWIIFYVFLVIVLLVVLFLLCVYVCMVLNTKQQLNKTKLFFPMFVRILLFIRSFRKLFGWDFVSYRFPCRIRFVHKFIWLYASRLIILIISCNPLHSLFETFMKWFLVIYLSYELFLCLFVSLFLCAYTVCLTKLWCWLGFIEASEIYYAQHQKGNQKTFNKKKKELQTSTYNMS